jgi:hypothetical protein
VVLPAPEGAEKIMSFVNNMDKAFRDGG